MELWGLYKWPYISVSVGLFHPFFNGVIGPYLELVTGPILKKAGFKGRLGVTGNLEFLLGNF